MVFSRFLRETDFIELVGHCKQLIWTDDGCYRTCRYIGDWGTDMRMIIAALVIAFGISGEANAGFLRGNKLHSLCTGVPADRSRCYNYIIGAFDMLDNWNKSYEMDPTLDKFMCIPNNITSTQIVDVVEKWVRDNPEKRHDPAVAAVILAATEAFPCE
jgi:hypothetical protein